MIYSLSRGGYAPNAWGRVTGRGVPLNALLVSSVGLLAAIVVAMRYARAYELLFGVSLFGGLFVWLMIFLTHLFFRRRNQSARVFLPAFPYLTLLGLGFMIAILASNVVCGRDGHHLKGRRGVDGGGFGGLLGISPPGVAVTRVASNQKSQIKNQKWRNWPPTRTLNQPRRAGAGSI